jgi:tape measure domain-containing protein
MSDVNTRIIISLLDQTRSGVESFVRNIGAMVAVAVGLNSVKDSLQGIIETGNQFETLKNQMEAAMGSAAEGEKAFEWVLKFAKDTPLELTDVADGFIKLTNAGINPTTGAYKALVDANAKLGGGQAHLNSLILATTQAWTAQKLQGGDIMQLTNARIPVYELLSKATGKSAVELRHLAEAGQLGRDAMKGFFTELGKWANGSADMAMTTWAGKVSNLKDVWAIFLNEISKSGVMDYAKEKISAIINVLSNGAADGSMKRWASNISDFIVGSGKMFENGFNTISRWASEIGDSISKYFNFSINLPQVSDFVSKMLGYFDKILPSSKSVFDAVSATVSGFISGLNLSGLDGLFGTVSKFAEDAVNKLLTVVPKPEKVIDLLKDYATAVGTGVGKAYDYVIAFKDKAIDAITSFTKGFSSHFDGLTLESLKARFADLVSAVATGMEYAVGMFGKADSTLEDWGATAGKVFSSVTNTLGGVGGAIQTVVGGMVVSFNLAGIAINKTGSAVAGFVSWVTGLEAKITGDKYMQAFSEKAKMAADSMDAATEEFKAGLDTSIDYTRKGLNGLAESFGTSADDMLSTSEKLGDGIEKDSKRQAQALEAGAKAADVQSEATYGVAQATQLYSDMLKKGEISQEEYLDTVKALGVSEEKASQMAKELTAAKEKEASAEATLSGAVKDTTAAKEASIEADKASAESKNASAEALKAVAAASKEEMDITVEKTTVLQSEASATKEREGFARKLTEALAEGAIGGKEYAEAARAISDADKNGAFAARNAAEDVSKLLDQYKDGKISAAEFSAEVSGLAASVGQAPASTTTLVTAYDKLGKSMSDTAIASDKLGSSTNAVKVEQQASGATVLALVKDHERLVAELKNIELLHEQGKASQQQVTDARTEEQSGLSRINSEMKRYTEQLDSMMANKSKEVENLKASVEVRKAETQSQLDVAKALGLTSEVKRLTLQLAKEDLEVSKVAIDGKRQEAALLLEKAKIMEAVAKSDGQYSIVEQGKVKALELSAKGLTLEADKMEISAQAAYRYAKASSNVAENLDKVAESSRRASEESVVWTRLYDPSEVGLIQIEQLSKKIHDQLWATYFSNTSLFETVYRTVIDLEMKFIDSLTKQKEQVSSLAESIAKATQEGGHMSTWLIQAGYHMNSLLPVADQVKARFSDLNEAHLDKLISAVQAAKDKMDALRESAQSALAALQDELYQLQGDSAASENLRYEQKIAELKKQLDIARMFGSTDSIDYYTKAIELEDKIHKIKMQNIEEERKKQAGSDSSHSGSPSKKAQGGPVTKGKPYIVGEEGEELFVPDSNGTIVPNGTLTTASRAASGSGGTVVVKLQFPSGKAVSGGYTKEDANRLLDLLKDAGMRSV